MASSSTIRLKSEYNPLLFLLVNWRSDFGACADDGIELSQYPTNWPKTWYYACRDTTDEICVLCLVQIDQKLAELCTF